MLVLLIAGAVVWTRTQYSSKELDTADAAEIFQGLRDQLLHSPFEDMGIALGPGEKVWGVLMEIGYQKGVATIVALRDGNASLYFSNGGGVIGGVAHDEVRAAAVSFVSAAEGELAWLHPTEVHPLPSPGQVRFIALTLEGSFAGGTAEDVLQQSNEGLGALYRHGQEVVTQLRRVAEKGAAKGK